MSSSKIDNYLHHLKLEEWRREEEVCKYLDQMYSEHREAIYRYALSKTRDPFRAEDVVQTVFQRLTSHLQRHDVREIKNFIGLAITTAKNLLSDMGQEDATPVRSNAQSLDDERNIGLRNSVVDERATRVITESIEIEDRLIKSMADATQVQKLMIARWREGLSRQEIAEDMGLNEETVKVELNRVLAKMRHRLRTRY